MSRTEQSRAETHGGPACRIVQLLIDPVAQIGMQQVGRGRSINIVIPKVSKNNSSSQSEGAEGETSNENSRMSVHLNIQHRHRSPTLSPGGAVQRMAGYLTLLKYSSSLLAAQTSRDTSLACPVAASVAGVTAWDSEGKRTTGRTEQQQGGLWRQQKLKEDASYSSAGNGTE